MNKRISPQKEKLLNPIVSRFNFTKRIKVGTTTELILCKEFKNKKEWEEFYYNSGKERQRLEKETKTKELSQLKRKYGRTEEELKEIGIELYEKVKKFKQITEEDCKNCIKQYVIDNTWEGIIEREKNTIKNLKQILGIENINKAPEGIDAGCAVDYEIELNNKKIGIQIKPSSYYAHDKANIREQNEEKQKKYPGKVFTVISEKDGTINNKEIIDKIKEEIKRLSQS